MIAYAIGFCFSANRNSVVLIRKNRPQWQAGRLNAPGGKIEPNEYPQVAMAREFLEETGIETKPEEWNLFAIMHGKDWQKDHSGSTEAVVYCYELANENYFNNARTCEEELVIKVNNAFIPLTGWRECIPNLNILIPLACSTEFERPIDLVWSKETIERKN